MSLQAAVRIRRGTFALDVRLEVAAGEVVVLLGPNGSGKSTVLSCLAGLLRADASVVTLSGRTLEDAEQSLPAGERAVGLVVQDYLLFPHLSVLENVAFGLRSRGAGKAAARERARVWLGRMGLDGRASSRPRELSGGQQQRVALARALATEPELLLLDEPLAALDAGTRATVRSELRRHLADFRGCALVVTHDPVDAMVLADRVVVLEDGVVVQSGVPAQVARQPRTEYVARLVGLNLLRGTADGTSVRLSGGGAAPASVRLAHPLYGEVLVAFSPAAVTLHRHVPDSSARNVWACVVSGVETHGDLVRVALDGPLSLLADVTPLAVAELELTPGLDVWAAVKASEIEAYAA